MPPQRRARADRDDRAGLGRALLQDVDRGAAADLAVDAVVLRRDRAFDDEDVLALVLLHRRLARRLGLVAGGGEERLVVVERDEVEDQLRRASGATVRSSDSVQPVHSWKWSQITEGRRAWTIASATCAGGVAGEPHRRREPDAEREKLPARHPEAILDALQLIPGNDCEAALHEHCTFLRRAARSARPAHVVAGGAECKWAAGGSRSAWPVPRRR